MLQTLQSLLTPENFEKIRSELVLVDESSAMQSNKLDLYYAVIKTGTTRPGPKVPLGNIFIPDGDDGCLIDFGERMAGIVIARWGYRDYSPTEDGLPECSTVSIPPINGRVGFRHGPCKTCMHGQFGENNECYSKTNYVLLTVIGDELALVQFKAKGVNHGPCNDAYKAFSGKVRGKTLSNLAVFGTRSSDHTSKKDGKKYTVWHSTILPGGTMAITPEQKNEILQLQKVILSFQVTKYQMQKQMVDMESQGMDGTLSMSYNNNADLALGAPTQYALPNNTLTPPPAPVAQPQAQPQAQNVVDIPIPQPQAQPQAQAIPQTQLEEEAQVVPPAAPKRTLKKAPLTDIDV